MTFDAVDSDRMSSPLGGTLDLRQDHRLMHELLRRFEQLDDYHARRDVMQLVTDLFEVHSAIESLTRRDCRELLRECEAVHELMEQVEASNPTSQRHFARGLELSRAFEAYIVNEELLVDDADFTALHRLAPHNAALLRERTRLMDYADRLLRLH